LSRPPAAPRSEQARGLATAEPRGEGVWESVARSRVGRNVAYNLAGQVALLGLGLLSARFLFRGLGEDAFGLILFATTLSATLSGLLELGLVATTVRAVAIHRDEADYLAEYVSTGSCLYWALYVVLAAAGWLLAPIIVEHWVHLRTLSPATAAELLRLLLVACFSALPRNLYSSLFRGFQRMEFNNGIDVGASALQQAGIVGLLVLGAGARAVAVWILVVAALALVAYLGALSRFLPIPALLPSYSHRVVRDQWRFAANVSGNSMLVTLFTQADKLVVSKLLALSAFGYYSFAWSSVWRVAALATVVSAAAFPSIAALIRSGSQGHLGAQYHRLDELVRHVFAVPMAAVAFAAWPLFRYLFGEGVANGLVVPVGLLCVAYYMYATMTMPMALAAASGRPQLITKVNVLALFTFLPALIALVAVWGLIGAAIAWLGYYCLSYLFLIPRVCRQCLDISPVRWYAGMAQVYLKLGGTYFLTWGICFLAFPHSPEAWVLGFSVATLLFALLAHPVIAGSLRLRAHQDLGMTSRSAARPGSELGN
jgi:O-antigen/teichoic acid export membrane protein